MRKPPRGGSSFPRRPRTIEPLEAGRRIRDTRAEREGEVLDHACQYAHPKADPVYNYLVRWDDGQITAISEMALEGHGLEVID